jgi:hypothetical protein
VPGDSLKSVKTCALGVPLAPFNHFVVGHEVLELLLPNLRTESEELMLLIGGLLISGNDFFDLSTALLTCHIGVIDESATEE